MLSQQRYLPFGEVRTDVPSPNLPATDFGYTGQRLETGGLGLMDYHARDYDPYITQFSQPDSIVPDPTNPQSLNRYSYVMNDPINTTDPTGHCIEEGDAPPGSISNRNLCSTESNSSRSNGGDSSNNSCSMVRNAGSPIPPPPIVPRSKWGALSPGYLLKSTEGRYPANPKGYAYYSELYPGKSLADILDTVVIHHEGNLQTYDVQKVQLDQMESGAYDIAYHYVIGRDGTIYEGRDIGARGAHVLEGNSGKIGALWLGDFEPGMAFQHGIHVPFDFNGTDSGPTFDQIVSTDWLLMWLDSEYGIENVRGHYQLNSDEVCPGANAIPYIPLLNDLVEGR